jgi:hypothetical protein
MMMMMIIIIIIIIIISIPTQFSSGSRLSMRIL